jgi:hypothetical protein
VAHGAVEAPAAGPSRERGRARGQAERLGADAPATVAPDRRVRDPEPLTQLERLGEIARGDVDVVAARAERLDHRPHHEDVRRVRQVDPDPHRAGE